MSKLTHCPNARVLQQAALGQVAVESVEDLARHLETCDSCTTFLHGLTADDSLLQAVRSAKQPADGPPQDLVEKLMHNLARLRPAGTPDTVGDQPGAARHDAPDTDRFEMQRNGRVTVRVLIDPAAVAGKDNDRKVAEWVVSLGGTAGLVVQDQGFVNQSSTEKFPEKPFRIITAGLPENQRLTDQDLSRFTGLPQFSTLLLVGTKVTDAGIKALGDLPDLQLVYLSQTAVGDAGAASLGRYPKLRTLHLIETKITDEGLKSLAKCKALTELPILGCPGVTAAGVKQLAAALPDCRIVSDHGTFGPLAAPADKEKPSEGMPPPR